MFDQTFVNTQAQTRKSWTVLVSLTGQTLLVGTLMLIPLLHPEVLYPKIDTKIFLPVRPRAPLEQVAASHAAATSRSTVPKAFTQPREIPKGVTPSRNVSIAEAPEGFAIAGALPGTGTGAGDAFSNMLQSALPGPPPPEPKHVETPRPAPPAGPIRVSSGVQDAKLIFGPNPDFSRVNPKRHLWGRSGADRAKPPGSLVWWGVLPCRNPFFNGQTGFRRPESSTLRL